MDYLKFLSKMALNHKPSGVGTGQATSPSTVYLTTGLQNPKMVPFEKATITLKDGKDINITPDVMKNVLNYGPAGGHEPFVKQLKTMTKRVHNPPLWDQSDLIVTAGGLHGLTITFETILDPGDYVVIQEPSYVDVLSTLSSFAPTYLKVEADGKGMCPDSLKEVLQKAVQKDPTRVPKVLYVIPTGHNPTGTSMDEERKKEIYLVASEYNLIILEDDPYYYLQYNNEEELTPSFLSMDRDGRVLRFDSFSKIISTGLRLGYVTGHKVLVERLFQHIEDTIMNVPGITQVMMSEVLEYWGDDGFKNHITKIQTFYKSQRDAMLLAADTHLKGLCEWRVPSGGFYIWFKVPALRDTLPMLKSGAVKKNVELLPGKDFMLDMTKPSQFMRASFSGVTPQQMMVAIKNLAELIKEEIELQKSEKVL